MKKTIGVIALILAMTVSLSSCTKDEGKATPTAAPVPTPNPELVKNTIEATIELENGDEIVLELYPDIAPGTVENFIELAEDGFYDGTIFHRVIEGFMIQGGGYDENLKEQDADTITGEFAANGFENSLAHARGVISMARTAQSMDSASSQFFIMQEYAPHLDGQYAAFGMVTEGIEIVDEIASVKTGSVAASGMQDVPVEPIIIESITVDTGNTTSKKSDKDDEKDTQKSTSKSDEDDVKSEEEETDTTDEEETLTEEDIMALFAEESDSL